MSPLSLRRGEACIGLLSGERLGRRLKQAFAVVVLVRTWDMHPTVEVPCEGEHRQSGKPPLPRAARGVFF